MNISMKTKMSGLISHCSTEKVSEETCDKTLEISTTETCTKSSIIQAIFQSKAFKEGISGAIGGAFQVIIMMWLRTLLTYQYRYGGTFIDDFVILYNQGGVARFYQGLSYAIIQGPLAKFGSVAANQLSRDILRIFLPTSFCDDTIAVVYATLLGSILAALWRLFLTPIDTCKTVLQVDGQAGFNRLISEVLQGNISVLYEGATATIIMTAISHYPWFFTYNLLETLLPKFRNDFLRNGVIGFVASAIADTISNFIRVIKTVKQSSVSRLSYYTIIIQIINEDGLSGLFGRGLPLRVLTNGIQSILFTIVWKLSTKYILKSKARSEKRV